MTFQVNLTEAAEHDLQNIYDYIAVDLKSPEIANPFLERIENQILTLSEFPERHRIYEKEPWQTIGLRIMPFLNHVIFYVVRNNEKTVTIIRILYGKRDFDTQLSKTNI